MNYRLQTSYYRDDAEDKVSRKVFLSLACALAVIFIFFISVGFAMQTKYRFILVSGVSMQNTLNEKPVGSGQDGVYILLTHDVDYGDIIVHKKSADTSVIKRVMAMEGDKICIARVKTADMEEEQIRFMRVKRNSNTVEILNKEDDYIKSYAKWDEYETRLNATSDGVTYGYNFYHTFIKDKTTATYNIEGVDYKFAVIPEGKIFFMGDNRSESVDCRERGAASYEDIEGKVVKIAHNVFSFKNSPFYLFNYVGSYFSLIWEEIMAYFSF